MTDTSAYYLIEGEPLLTIAQEFRESFIAARKAINKYVEGIENANGYQFGWRGKLAAVRFKGSPPEGFKKPDRHGGCAPKKASKWAAEFDALTTLPQPMEWVNKAVKWPTSLEYETETGSGWQAIGGFNPLQICWFDPDGPLLLVAPDVALCVAKKKAEEPGCTIMLDVEGWEIPPGLKRIMKEEWDLWSAQYKAKKRKAA